MVNQLGSLLVSFILFTIVPLRILPNGKIYTNVLLFTFITFIQGLASNTGPRLNPRPFS